MKMATVALPQVQNKYNALLLDSVKEFIQEILRPDSCFEGNETSFAVLH